VGVLIAQGVFVKASMEVPSNAPNEPPRERS